MSNKNPINGKRTEGNSKAKAARFVPTPTVSKGGLTKSKVDVLLSILPRTAWGLVHAMFTGKDTTFNGPAVSDAAKVQDLTTALLSHPCFAVEASAEEPTRPE